MANLLARLPTSRRSAYRSKTTKAGLDRIQSWAIRVTATGMGQGARKNESRSTEWRSFVVEKELLVYGPEGRMQVVMIKRAGQRHGDCAKNELQGKKRPRAASWLRSRGKADLTRAGKSGDCRSKSSGRYKLAEARLICRMNGLKRRKRQSGQAQCM